MFMKIKANASIDKEKQKAFSKRLLSSFQRGSILIGIIVTMVVMAVLGSGMLYLTTTSTLNELIYGSHSEAYFVAEAGGRYAKSVIRDAYANDKAKLNTINANQIFTLSNGNKFQIRDWTLQSSNPDTITFSSVGIVGSGFMKAERLIAYRVQPANQTGGSGSDGPNGPINFNDYPLQAIYGDKLHVKPTVDGLSMEMKSAKQSIMIASNSNFIYTGNYDVQIKTLQKNCRIWDIGLMFNIKQNGTSFPYGYGLAYYNYWDDIDIVGNRPDRPTGYFDHATQKPILLLWQNAPNTGINWIAYAILSGDVINSWMLDMDGKPPTLVVKVIRHTTTPAYNEIRVYIGDPSTMGSPDTSPKNYGNRRGYGLWTTALDDIKWPPFNGTWDNTLATTNHYSGDFFTMIYSTNTSSNPPVLSQWYVNPSIGTVTLSSDDNQTLSTSNPLNPIANAVIKSTIMTDSSIYNGVGLYFIVADRNPWVEFSNFAINVTNSSGGSDGSGTVIQY